jgi:hypothetical protein
MRAQGLDRSAAQGQLRAAAESALADMRAAQSCLAASSDAPNASRSRLINGDFGAVEPSITQSCTRSIMMNDITACHNA